MDSEDRDHFKTIAGALPRPSTGGSSRPNNSASRLDPASCLKSAKLIAGCYRRDEAQNPELFADALALVLGDYPVEIVRLAVDPRTGIIERFPMGLPNVGQIKQYLNDLLTQHERLKRYQALPKFQPTRPVLKKAEPNLFVPSDNRRFEALAKKAEAQPDRAMFVNYVCADGVTRAGVLVPLGWYDVQADDAHAKRLAELARDNFLKHCAAEGVTIAGQPISKELAEKLTEQAAS